MDTGGALLNSELGETWKTQVFHKNLFFNNSGWNWGSLGVSGGSARSTRRHSVEFSQDLVLHGIGKSIVQHLTVNWNFNVLEMAFKTIHIAQGLSRKPLWIFPRSLTTRFSKNIPQRSNISKIGNPVHGQKQVEVSLFVSAGTVPGILVENGPRPTTK